MGECQKGTLLLVLFLAMTLKFFIKYGNINSICHSDKISADSEC